MLTSCNDAESALVHVRRNEPFDIMIRDFTLPRMPGIELIAHVRANEGSAAVPIVMIGGHASCALDAQAKSAGANVFLNKPFTLRQLRSAVESLLDGQLCASNY